MGSCIDLRKYQDVSAVQSAFAKLVSGKSTYQPIIERRIEPVKCPKCGKVITDNSKFCPECGEKVERKPTSFKCGKCANTYDGDEKFCTTCGTKRE